MIFGAKCGDWYQSASIMKMRAIRVSGVASMHDNDDASVTAGDDEILLPRSDAAII